MSKPSTKASTEAYFDNPDRDKNVDITKVLDFEGTFSEIEKEVQENISDTQLDYNKKIEIMLNYRRELFLNHMQAAQEASYIELSVNFIIELI